MEAFSGYPLVVDLALTNSVTIRMSHFLERLGVGNYNFDNNFGGFHYKTIPFGELVPYRIEIRKFVSKLVYCK